MNALLRGALALALTMTSASAQEIGPGIAQWQAGVICPSDSDALESSDFIARTRVVPAVVDLAFGVRAQASMPDGFRDVVITVTHPPFPATGETEQTYRSSVRADGLSGFYFRFDRPSEIVTGAWRITARVDGFVLYDIPFRVIAPSPTEGLLRECGVISR